MIAPRWPGPLRIAHRGGGTLAPENTLAAIRVGMAFGYRGVEFDVMLTADDVPVLMHDASFGRTIAGAGDMARTLSRDLLRMDAGAWFGDPRFVGEPVPRYEDVVRFCLASDVWMNAEIKPTPGRERVTARVVGEMTARLAGNRGGVLFSSFSVDALIEARGAAPDMPRGLLVDALHPSDVADARALGCASVHVGQRHIDATMVERLHEAGLAVMAYTVDDVDRIGMLERWGVDAVCTDRIDRIAARTDRSART